MKFTLKIAITAAVASISGFQASAQVKIGNNPTTIGANSILEIESTNKGLLVPRLALSATTNASPLSAHVAGMTVYNTSTVSDVVPAYYYNDGTKWVQIADASKFWGITGNKSTAPGANGLGLAADGNYWGTSDAQNLIVGTNGVKRMLFDQSGNAYGGTGTTIASPATNSFAWGATNSATEANSATFGTNNTNSSSRALVFGHNNTLGPGNAQTNRGTILGGGGNSVTAGNSYNSMINGSQNTVTGDCFESIITGFVNSVTNTQKVIVSGQGNVVNGATFGFVVGKNNNATGGYGLAYGESNTVAATLGVAIGESNNVASTHTNSFAFGKNAVTSAAGQFVARFAGGYNLFSDASTSVGVTLGAGSSSWVGLSDRRSKDNIKDINYGLNAVMQLRPATYNYKGQKKASLGFIAQEVKEVLPEVVEQTTMGPDKDYLGIKYSDIIPVLTKAIQELKNENDALKSSNSKLTNQVADVRADLGRLEALVSEIKELKASLTAGKATGLAEEMSKK